MTQPTSIDVILEEFIEDGKNRSYLNDNNWTTSEIEEYGRSLREKLTTLVEQARGEGRNQAVDYIDEHYSAKAPKSTAIQDFNELTEVLESARTISSDSK